MAAIQTGSKVVLVCMTVVNKIPTATVMFLRSRSSMVLSTIPSDVALYGK